MFVSFALRFFLFWSTSALAGLHHGFVGLQVFAGFVDRRGVRGSYAELARVDQ